jgi:hypothetical protein
MPGCSVEREVVGTTAWYRISGRFESACAWDLAGRLVREPLAAVGIDFSRVDYFADYGIAAMANALLALSGKSVHLLGLRQHQARLFKYFGVDAEALAHRADESGGAEPSAAGAEASEVA